jgi:hypothetical protein
MEDAPQQFSLATFDLESVLEHGTELLGSSGVQYKLTPELEVQPSSPRRTNLLSTPHSWFGVE